MLCKDWNINCEKMKIKICIGGILTIEKSPHGLRAIF